MGNYSRRKDDTRILVMLYLRSQCTMPDNKRDNSSTLEMRNLRLEKSKVLLNGPIL